MTKFSFFPLRFIFAFFITTSLFNSAQAEIAFVSVSNPNAIYLDKKTEPGNEVFLFNGLAKDEATSVTLAVTGDCPFMAISAGAKFDADWTCSGGTITATLTNKGGLGW